MKLFNEWVNDNGDNYTFSKDYLQMHISPDFRVYSPETCCFVKNTDPVAMPAYMPYEAFFDDYSGVSFRGRYYAPYRITLFNQGKSILDDVFFDAYHAAVYRNYYARYYGLPTNPNVPCDDRSFYEAQMYRGGSRKNTYPYKQMYRLVDNGNKGDSTDNN